MWAVETKDLTRTFGAFTAVDKVTLNIRPGSIYGFLGPNGDNNNIQYNGGGNTYVITANIKLGIYKVTPQ